MAGESRGRSISGNAARDLHHSGSALLNGLLHFSASIKSMHPSGQHVAGIQISRLCRPHHTSWNIPLEGPSLDAGEGLPNLEAEAGVKRERAIVIRSLHQPHSRGTPLVGSSHHRLHQLAPNAEVLCAGIDGNRANASDHGTFVEAIATHDAAAAFRHHTVKTRTGK